MNLPDQLGSAVMLVCGLVAAGWIIISGCAGPHALDKSPGRRAGIVGTDLVVGLVLMLLAMFAFQVVLAAMGHWQWIELSGPAGSPPLQTAWLTLAGQVFTQLPVVVCFLLACATRRRHGLLRAGVIPRAFGRSALTGLIGLVAAVPMVMSLGALVILIGSLLGQPAPTLGHDLLKVLSGSDSALASGIIAFSALVVAPPLEEIIFRGLVQTALLEVLGRSRRWSVVLCAAAFFAIVHAQIAAWQSLPSLLLLGVVLGWLYERTGSLWPGIVLHSGFNTFMVLMQLAAKPA